MANETDVTRRRFLGLAGKAGLATFAARAIGVNTGLIEVLSAATKSGMQPFSFAIITDSHLFSADNHRFDRALADAVNQVNALTPAVDFVMYTGDIAQNGREDQLLKGKKILSALKAPLKVIPGEHDWYLDMGKVWNGLFGKETWSFDHKGVHFIGLNSILVRDFWSGTGMTPLERMSTMEMLESPVAGPWGVRDAQLEFLRKDVKRLGASTPVVIFTHSPLWDYYPRWNFQTEDAPQIREILSKFDHVTSLHGHVHQTVYNKFGNMSSAGSLSTSWPWPYPPVKLDYPGSQMNQSDPANTKDGMGTQSVSFDASGATATYEPFANSLTAISEGRFEGLVQPKGSDRTSDIMKSTKRKAYLAVGAASIGLLGALSIWARPPFTDAQLADQQQQLLDVVNKGRDLWHGSNPQMSGNGLACGNCHPDAAASNPQSFPKWVSEIGSVAPMRDMINWCIVHPQGGQALDPDGSDMIALEAYAFYLYRGQKIEPGLAVPTPPDPVKSGVGYPHKGSGIGFDK